MAIDEANVELLSMTYVKPLLLGHVGSKVTLAPHARLSLLRMRNATVHSQTRAPFRQYE